MFEENKEDTCFRKFVLNYQVGLYLHVKETRISYKQKCEFMCIDRY